MTLYPTSVKTSNGRFISPIICMGTAKPAAAYSFPQLTPAFVVAHIATAGTPVNRISTFSTDKITSRHEPALSATALELQARLRARWPAVLARTRGLEESTPDSVRTIIDLLGNLPGDYAVWREIIEEPYG